tara:strand:+ start:28151 stop:28336 length:186 start_codon:yes stop_codon:yes gene_type:complete
MQVARVQAVLLGPNNGDKLAGRNDEPVEEIFGPCLEECVIDGCAVQLAKLETFESRKKSRR